jgi:[ribosomal protein S5]-alanine N-acetyltransferase
MFKLTTTRLTLRELNDDDAPFILTLLNDPDFIRFIADRGVRSLDDARAYIRNGPVASYAQHGHGLWRVAIADADTPIGMCGLIKRAGLPHPDIGYAYLPEFRGQGYAVEAAAAALAFARDSLKLTRLLGITSMDNDRSGRVLNRIGMRRDGEVRLPDGAECILYAIDFSPV